MIYCIRYIRMYIPDFPDQHVLPAVLSFFAWRTWCRALWVAIADAVPTWEMDCWEIRDQHWTTFVGFLRGLAHDACSRKHVLVLCLHLLYTQFMYTCLCSLVSACYCTDFKMQTTIERHRKASSQHIWLTNWSSYSCFIIFEGTAFNYKSVTWTRRQWKRSGEGQDLHRKGFALTTFCELAEIRHGPFSTTYQDSQKTNALQYVALDSTMQKTRQKRLQL